MLNIVIHSQMPPDDAIFTAFSTMGLSSEIASGGTTLWCLFGLIPMFLPVFVVLRHGMHIAMRYAENLHFFPLLFFSCGIDEDVKKVFCKVSGNSQRVNKEMETTAEA